MKTNVEQQVMAGVASIYVARKLTSRTALECYVLFLSSFCLTLFVSLSSVVHNFLLVERGGVGSTFNYLVSAVLNTNLLVQATLVFGFVAFILLARDILRANLTPKFA